MAREIIQTENAPQAIGTYSQAVKVNGVLYVSGQIPLRPGTGEVVAGDVATQVGQAFDNLKAVIEAAGGQLGDIVKLTVYLTDLGNFSLVNDTMERLFEPPYPARAAVGVAQLPRDVAVEVDAICVLDG